MTIPDALAVFGAKYLFLAVVAIGLIVFIRQDGPTRRRIVFLAAFSWPTIFIIAGLLSLFYRNPRPFVEHGFTPLIPHEPDNGFPSDHALLCAAIASTLQPFHKQAALAAWLLTLLVGFSRVYAGVHHPIDILGSMIIAALTTVMVNRMIKSGSRPELTDKPHGVSL